MVEKRSELFHQKIVKIKGSNTLYDKAQSHKIFINMLSQHVNGFKDTTVDGGLYWLITG